MDDATFIDLIQRPEVQQAFISGVLSSLDSGDMYAVLQTSKIPTKYSASHNGRFVLNVKMRMHDTPHFKRVRVRFYAYGSNSTYELIDIIIGRSMLGKDSIETIKKECPNILYEVLTAALKKKLGDHLYGLIDSPILVM